jgi:hypothetical protein
MSPELTKQLYDKFPDLFKEKDLPPEQSNMCWGFECSDGWYNIIFTLCSLIQIHQKSQKSDYKPVVVQQVKEKFGTLRFYYTGGDDIIFGMVAYAEAISGMTCEVCGDKGTTDWKRSWVRTVCSKHIEN